jgi:uncharacterized membrane protein YedE/YeeE
MKYLLSGIFFGIVLIKSEVVSWFRIQEMFRFDAFHMYGVIGSAVIIGMVSIQLIKRYNMKDSDGQAISIPPKDSSQMYRYSIGGLIFGLGWALTGACPGPLFALLGSGWTIMLVPITGAIVGTWTYGLMRNKLPH